MIDVNDLNKLDCAKAKESVESYLQWKESKDIGNVLKFIDQVETLQRKYTKPIAALLKKGVDG